MGRPGSRSAAGDEDEFTAAVVERFSIEATEQSLELEPRDIDEPNHAFFVAHHSELVAPSSSVTSVLGTGSRSARPARRA
jgi:hypothetical protein